MTQIDAGGRTLTLETFAPQAVPAPGILYLHELMGMSDGYREDARELAGRGYLVYLPDLYSGQCMRYVFDAFVRAPGRENRADNPLLREIDVLLDTLAADERCTGRLGMLGMCMTAGYVIQMAKRPDMDAPVLYHHSLGLTGSGVPDDEPLHDVRRIQGHWVEPDIFCPRARRERLIARLGDRVEPYLYFDVKHGLRSVSRKTDASRLAWDRTLDFFDRQLKRYSDS